MVFGDPGKKLSSWCWAVACFNCSLCCLFEFFQMPSMFPASLLISSGDEARLTGLFRLVGVIFCSSCNLTFSCL